MQEKESIIEPCVDVKPCELLVRISLLVDHLVVMDDIMEELKELAAMQGIVVDDTSISLQRAKKYDELKELIHRYQTGAIHCV
tara:strand:+ start:4440 stop:4688 length:249 start_codon:yes stop_codon:yes gene_type:complete